MSECVCFSLVLRKRVGVKSIRAWMDGSMVSWPGRKMEDEMVMVLIVRGADSCGVVGTNDMIAPQKNKGKAMIGWGRGIGRVSLYPPPSSVPFLMARVCSSHHQRTTSKAT